MCEPVLSSSWTCCINLLHDRRWLTVANCHCLWCFLLYLPWWPTGCRIQLQGQRSQVQVPAHSISMRAECKSSNFSRFRFTLRNIRWSKLTQSFPLRHASYVALVHKTSLIFIIVLFLFCCWSVWHASDFIINLLECLCHCVCFSFNIMMSSVMLYCRTCLIFAI